MTTITSVESIREQARSAAAKWSANPTSPSPRNPFCDIEFPAHCLRWRAEFEVELLRLSASAHETTNAASPA